ncbi:MAG: TPM domain-containing protein [Clostridia bacterium]|nr:TPM domain-containing protein [Clostridia bacterium]
MNKTLRTLSILVLALVMCFGTVTYAFANANIPAATSDFYVNDFAGVFAEEEKSKLMTNAVTLANEFDGIQVVVTTIKSLEGDTVENYAYNMYNQYGIGKDDMGLLILLATEDRQIRVEVGRTMEGYINDAKAGRFMDQYAIPYLKENKFNEGLISLQEAFIAEIRDSVKTEKGTGKGDAGNNVNVDWVAMFGVIAIICVVGACVWLVISVVIRIKKKSEEKKQYIEGLNDEIASLKSTVATLQITRDNLQQDRNHLYGDLEDTRQVLSNLQSRHNRILEIYPDADRKVDEMIEAEKIARDKAAANRVDEHISEVINLKPDKNLVSRLETIKSEIDFLNFDESKYLESDLDKFNRLYSACLTLKREYDEELEQERIRRLTEQRKQKAADITSQLLGVISLVGIVSASDLSKLKDAKSLYDGLDHETRSYVDDSAVSKIEELLRKAKRAKEEEEEAERRRRASYSSSSSYRNSHSSFGGGGFGGFGGRSGGGGASRGF